LHASTCPAICEIRSSWSAAIDAYHYTSHAGLSRGGLQRVDARIFHANGWSSEFFHQAQRYARDCLCPVLSISSLRSLNSRYHLSIIHLDCLQGGDNALYETNIIFEDFLIIQSDAEPSACTFRSVQVIALYMWLTVVSLPLLTALQLGAALTLDAKKTLNLLDKTIFRRASKS
jgi:hypothetical protein